ncbi:Alpha-amylase type B isozyme [Nymphaea thermarum]|nr:Alpha-amylase type B isozyme [Nymphaea thermarum]
MNSLKPPCKHHLKSHMEQMIVVKFLAGLSSDYSASKVQMLTGSDFSDLDEAFNRLNRMVDTLPPSSNNPQPSTLASFGGGRSGLYSSRQSFVVDGSQTSSNICSCLILGILHSALHNQYWRLIDPQGKPTGVMGWWPSRAVTFLENHDTGRRAGIHCRSSVKIFHANNDGYVAHVGDNLVMKLGYFDWNPSKENQLEGSWQRFVDRGADYQIWLRQ